MQDNKVEYLEYLDFELEISGSGREYSVEVIHSPAGETEKITMRFPFDELELKNKLMELQVALLRSSGGLRKIVSSKEQPIQDFGQKLFDSLFHGELRDRYVVSKREASIQGKGLRLKLRIQSPALASLPWEFLYDSREGNYVCLSTKTPIVRYMKLPQPVESLTVKPPLRILGMIASPPSLPALNVEREKQRMEESIKNLHGLIELTWLNGQTWQDLMRAMRRGPWHIFHFVGHGGFDREIEQGVVALAEEGSQTHFRLTATQLGRLLADHSFLRLVLLNSCEGAEGSERDIFSSTASILVQRGIPAVLAMQYEISDRAAIEFSRTFYGALADEMPIDAAISQARMAISMALDGSVEWGTPVLYMRSYDGVMFRIQQKEISSLEEERRKHEEQEKVIQLERERQEHERQEKTAQLEKERQEREEQEKATQLERERQESEAKEKAVRLEKERQEREEQEKAIQLERERQESEAKEKAARLEKERQERKEQEKVARLERERQESEAKEKAVRLEKERQERKEQEKVARLEKERLESEAKEKVEKEKEKQEREEQEKTVSEDNLQIPSNLPYKKPSKITKPFIILIGASILLVILAVIILARSYKQPQHEYEPVITEINPSSGPPRGGTPITIEGNNFKQGAKIFIGGDSASNVNFVSENTLKCTTPSGTTGPAQVDVWVETDNGKLGSKPFTFTYTPVSVQPKPVPPVLVTPKPVPVTPVQKKGTLSLETIPSDVHITIDKTYYGQTYGQPKVIELPEGTYRLKLSKKYYFDYEVTVTIESNNDTPKRIVLDPKLSIIGNDDAEMVLIPEGEFQMGSNDGGPDEKPVHTVNLDAFYMDKYEVTNKQYRGFVRATTGQRDPESITITLIWGGKVKGKFEPWQDKNFNGDNQPVVCVNWDDAKAYADWAGKRLPTEAEWEKAARGRLVGKKYPWGDDLTHDNANYKGTGGNDKWEYTSPVGSFAPNGYGLYDMAGNVWEWCADGSGSSKVFRGGSWWNSESESDLFRVAYRYFNVLPTNGTNDAGFRCVQ